jgi:hypothetical protein
LGVAAVYGMLRRTIPEKAAVAVSCLLSLSAPLLMAQQNFDDHDRSGRYTARDAAFNYLNSCAPDAILFTVGDNDTFPLWYLQEVEGVRTDVRVVNLMLLNTDWYINQMKQAVYKSPPLPLTLPEEKYLRGRRDIIYAMSSYNDTVSLPLALSFINSDAPDTKIILDSGEEINYIMSRNFSLPVARQKVIDSGAVKPEDAAFIPDSLPFRIPTSSLTKGQLMVLEIIAENNWERPIYWTSCKHSGTVGLDDYLQLEGAAYRLTPIKTPSNDFLNVGRIDTDIMYDRLMNTFRWEGVNNPDVWLDSHHLNMLSVIRARHIYTRLALQLLAEDSRQRAVEVLNRAFELFPASRVHYDYFSLLQADAMYQAEMTDVANAELLNYATQLLDEIDYFYSLSPFFFEYVRQKAEMNVELLGQIINITEEHGQTQTGEYIKQRLGY